MLLGCFGNSDTAEVQEIEMLKFEFVPDERDQFPIGAMAAPVI